MVGALDTELGQLLAAVEKPGRYAGGEYGTVLKEGPSLLRLVISYPDLYEIGMSNLAVRLIYRLLNGLEGVACERVFAPALDFERALRARGRLLCSLESGRPLRSFDLLGFSVGYELTFTNLLAMLDLGGVSIRRESRAADEPIVIAGGPAVTNPVPFGAYVDAVFIGEIEGEALDLIGELARRKRQGARRAELLAALSAAPYVWTADGDRHVRRVLWTGFGGGGTSASVPPAAAFAIPGGSGTSASVPPAAVPPTTAQTGASFPVPSLRTVQDHGVVEIMRGCPNGCRFCHAGTFYRPFRVKDSDLIIEEIDALVFGCGYREIALSSLSTGDFPGIVELVRGLNQRYRRQRVSFSLPSLRIDSLGLELLSEISAIRKSGLTFAVETPVEAWQRGVNKLAPLDRTLQILEEARARGWRAAKFYFMVGLPVAGGEDEVGPIVDFLRRVRERTRLELTANVSAFIPKPHTAFQWAAQLTELEALHRIMTVKKSLAAAGVKVRYHAPFLSLLEGVISRGDERAGELAGEAFRRGARFDSWEELTQRELWRQVLAEADWRVEEECCRARGLEEPLPWDRVRLGVSAAHLREERRRALAGELTAACAASCSQPCGVCGPAVRPRLPAPEPAAAPAMAAAPPVEAASASTPRRVLFSFSKAGPALYLGHLDVLGVFERAFQRARYEPVFTEGFNPKPRLEFAQALPLGVASQEEIALVTLEDFDDPQAFRARLNRALPTGLQVLQAQALPPFRPGMKKHSPMALYWGSDYLLRCSGDGGVPTGLEAGLVVASAAWTVLPRSAAGELQVRAPATAKPGNILKILAGCGVENPASLGLEVIRTRCWAAGPGGNPVSYFDLELPS